LKASVQVSEKQASCSLSAFAATFIATLSTTQQQQQQNAGPAQQQVHNFGARWHNASLSLRHKNYKE
jgi:hypothetical protein